LALSSVALVSCSDWYYDKWCGGSHEYLDDSKCVKVFPESFDRNWQCEVPVVSSVPEGYNEETTLDNVVIDVDTLGNIITETNVNLCAILTKRVLQEDNSVKLYNKYLCAGNRSATVSYETWSSSKIFAVMNAAGHLRSNETTCANDVFGLDGTTNGKHGTTPFGDLTTVIASYDTTAGYSSNSLSSYFHDIGWRDHINSLVNDGWLGATVGATSQTLGGNYGEATPSDLGMTFVSATDGSTCAADKDPWPTIRDNTISALSAVEMARRIAQHQSVDEELRFPGATWADVQTLLYGAESSALFSGLKWGGMSADTAIFLQQGLQLSDYLEKTNTMGKWRIFSKMGCGWSTSRLKGEIVTTAYTCLPTYNTEGVSTGGIEFTLSARGSIDNDYDVTKVDQLVHDVVSKAVSYIMENEVM